MRTATPIVERIARLAIVTEAGCWLWRGHIADTGYGRMTIDGRVELAHRASYESHVGPIPDGLQIDHLCRNRACVNPAHLEPVTQRENILRSPISVAALNASKTHCPAGHAYAGRNLIVEQRPNGRTARRCRTCRGGAR